MVSPLVSRIGLQTNNATTYISLGDMVGAGANATESFKQSVMANSGTLNNLFVKFATAPGVGKNWVLILRVNGVDTALTLTIADSAVSGSDTTHSVSYSAGDKLSVKVVPTGTPATTLGGMSLDGSSTTQQVVSGDETALSTSANNYLGLFNGRAVAATTDQALIMPTAGTISNLYVGTDVAPGGTASYTVTLVKNGIDQTLTSAISAAATSNTNLANSVSVVAGDTVYWKVVPATTPAAARIRIGVRFAPTTDGESVIMYGTTGALTNAGLNNFMAPGSGAGGANATEVNRGAMMSTSYVLKNFYCAVDTAPGATASYTFTVRSALANTTLTAQITGAGVVSANDLTHTPNSTAGDWLTVNAVSAGAPTATPAQWSFVTYRAPVTAFASGLTMTGIG